MTFKKVAIDSAKEAGKVLLASFSKKYKVMTKAGKEIVTSADLASEKIIISNIKKNFPDHRILSEEEGRVKGSSDYLWVVDPLDGTTNFSMRNPLFSISIALFCGKDPILGLVYVPFLGDLYYAERGGGATLNGKKIKVSSEKKLSNSFFAICHGNSSKDIKKSVGIYSKLKGKTRDIRKFGSAAIECAWVASGNIEGFIAPGVKPWDVAAGALIVREAGGAVTDLDGSAWILDSEGIVASGKLSTAKLFL